MRKTEMAVYHYIPPNVYGEIDTLQVLKRQILYIE